MNRFRNRTLAVVLAAATALSSLAPGSVFAAESEDTGYATNAPAETELAAEQEPEQEPEVEVEEEKAEEAKTEESAPSGQEQDPAPAVEDGQDSGSQDTAAPAKEVKEDGEPADGTEEASEAGTTQAPAKEEEPAAEVKEEKGTGRFAVRFDSEGGIVKVIVASDDGASEDDPSYKLEKSDGTVRVTERNGNSYDAAMTDGFALNIEVEEGDRVTVIAESADGFHVSRYSVTADAGGEEDTGFEGTPASFSFDTDIAKGGMKIFAVDFEEEKAENGTVAVTVSAGGKVTVTAGEETYTITKTAKGDLSVTDKDGNAVAPAAEGFDLVLEKEIGTKVSVNAQADEGGYVTSFAVTGKDGAQEQAVKAEDKNVELTQEITVSEGQTAVSVSFVNMPEFTAEQKVGKYTVKIHAAEGVLPAGTTVEVREMTEDETKPFVQEAEKTAGGEVVAAFDITFKDAEGKEIQPAGMVDVSFEGAVEDNSTMSVVHAVEGKADNMETVPSDTEGDSVTFQSSTFSPFLLTASADWPGSNWTKGGGGIKDVSSQIAVKHDNEYRYFYRDYGFFNGDDDYPGDTFCLGMYVGGQRVGWSVCVDPLRDGRNMEGVWAGEVWQVSAPMFVKVMYYGVDGPRSDVIKSATGYSDYGALNIIEHVAASEIYARLGYSSQSDVGDGFLAASGSLKNAVYKYVNTIADMDTPSGYYTYVTEKNGYSDEGYRHQNFAFGSFSLLDGTVKIQKVSSKPEYTNGNPMYSLQGARYWVYDSEAHARAKQDAGWMGASSTMITGADGISNTVTLPPGTYWMIEANAPAGFKLNKDPVRFTVAKGQTNTVTVTDVWANDPIALGIDKKAVNAIDETNINSLEETQFTVKYYNGSYDASNLPASATRTWVIHPKKTAGGNYAAALTSTYLVSGDSFYIGEAGNVTLPLGTLTIEETKAAPGYANDGTFGGAKMYIGHIVADSNAPYGGTLVDVQGKRKTTNTFEVSDSVLPPRIKTTATEKDSGSHSAYAGSDPKNITIVDRVAYENLVVNSEYTMKGKLVDKGTGEVVKDADGKEVTAEKTFKATAINGFVDLEFTFKADDSFKNKTTVAFETLQYKNKDVTAHADINDVAQTILFPEIGTTAVGTETGEHLVLAGEDAKIDDTVTYKNLVVGQQYVLKGVVMDKATGNPLLVNGDEVRVEKTFTPTEKDGSVVMNFVFDAKGLDGKKLVIFEELYVGTTLIEDHKEINDLGQTVSVPGVETESADEATETKNQFPAGASMGKDYEGNDYTDQVIVDAVKYTGLVAGKEYKITGETKIKEKGVGSFDDAETVPSKIVGATGEGQISFDDEKVTFTPAGKEGELVDGVVYVSFQVDASDLAGEEVVVGETILYKEKEVAVHRDINDTKQNIIYPAGKTTAIDTETGIKNSLAADNRVFKDTFEYENLLPGETYRFTGSVWGEKLDENGEPVVEDGKKVMEEIQSVMVDENGEPVPNGYIEFVPEADGDAQAVAGSLDLYFSIDATDLMNKDVTVFERVTLNGKPVIVHEVLDGTQTIYIPEGQTTAIDSESMDQIAFADEEITIYDTFKFRNLIPGTEYTLSGRTMLKESAEEIESALTEAEFAALDDVETTGTISVADNIVTFTPDQKDGAIKLSFVINGSDLAGEDVVVFERAYHNGKEVIIHENLEDKAQTVHVPDGFTQATDPDTDDHTMMAKGDVTIRDRVHYENVLPGYEYVLKGKVMLKPIGDEEPTELEAKLVDAEGNEIEEWKFTAEEKDGDEYLYFVINADELAGRSVVMFENMEFLNPELETRTVIFTHEDIDDEDQTVHFPDGHTTALDSDTGSHNSYADEEVTINDEVFFTNLIPGKTYTLDGVLYDKETGLPLVVDGKEVTAFKEFVPETADGSTIISFTFNGLGLEGKTVVAGETMKSNGKEVFIHFDLEDEEQTVHFPKVRTTAVDKKDSDHEISYKGTATIVDTVSYENVIVGTKYHVTGVLMNKATGEPAKAGGKEIVGDAVFVAKDTKGTVQVTFKFNAAELAAGDYVVYEKLYEVNAETGDEKPVGSHEDINDKSQTVKRPPTPKKPRTGDDNNVFMWIALFGAAAAGTAGAFIYRKKKFGK